MTEITNTRFHFWLLAVRPKTLPAAAAPVIVGSSIAFYDGNFVLGPALACLVVALFLQIGSNLANDVFDFEKGADQGERFGPTRVAQAGLLTPREIKLGMLIVFCFCVVIGFYLFLIGGWIILIVGVLAILSAILYTGGPFPLGYHGLGDIFVFIFFGLVAVIGTYYVQVHTITLTVWWMAVAMGLLTVAILVVNNLRDIEADEKAKKRTLAVRFGSSFVRSEYVLCLFGAYVIPMALWATYKLPVSVFVIYFTIPISIQLGRSIYRDTGHALNKTLAGTGRLELLYGLCFAFGLVANSFLGQFFSIKL